MKELRLCYCEFPSELPFAFPTFRFSLLPEHRGPVRVGNKGGGARESAHGLRRHRLFLAQPEPPRPQSPGLFLQPRTRPTLASPGQGSAQVRATSQVGPAPGRPGPPVRSSPWTPASGDGRGPRRPPPRQLRLGRRECAPPATPPRTYLQGREGLLDSGHGPEGGRRGGRRPSRGLQVSPVGQGGQRRRGTAAGQRGPSRGSRGPGSPFSNRPPPPPFCLPLGVAAAALRCRFPGCGHFPASLARGPRTGGFGPPGDGE